MNVTFKNLGPIKEATLELNDLTIIAGPNNTGKTYITYALYGFLKKWEQFFSLPFAGEIAEQLLNKGTITISKEQVVKDWEHILARMSQNFSRKIPGIFSDLEGHLNRASFSIAVPKPESVKKIRTIEIKIGDNQRLQGKIENDAVIISLTGTGEKFPHPFIIKDMVNQVASDLVFSVYFPTPFIATAERVGISLFYKELDATKNVLVEELQNLKKGEESRKGIDPFELIDKMSSRYAFPIKDNIHFTRIIGDLQKSGRNDGFKPALDKLKEMMGGYFKKVEKEIRFISKARKEDRFDIPLYLGSTSARELSDIYFFLAYIAEPGMLLMIDEPESHLNPGNQVEMARLLALCVQAGLKVFITTHSDYLVKELNNLIMLSFNFKGKEDFLKQNARLYSGQQFLKPGSVNAYLSKNGTLEKCSIDNKGMNITSFDDSINEINRITDELDFLTGE